MRIVGSSSGVARDSCRIDIQSYGDGQKRRAGNDRAPQGDGRCYCRRRRVQRGGGTLHVRAPGPLQRPAAAADPLVHFSKDDIALVYGSIWKQRYLKKDGDDYFPFPAQRGTKSRIEIMDVPFGR